MGGENGTILCHRDPSLFACLLLILTTECTCTPCSLYLRTADRFDCRQDLLTPHARALCDHQLTERPSVINNLESYFSLKHIRFSSFLKELRGRIASLLCYTTTNSQCYCPELS